MTTHMPQQLERARRLATRWISAGVLVLLPLAVLGCGDRPGSSVGAVVDERIERELVREGEGEIVRPGRLVQVHYQRFGPDGRVMLDTRGRGKPHDWVIGDRSTFHGLDRAIRGMQQGSVWNVSIPPDLHESFVRGSATSDRDQTPRTAGPVRYRIEIVSVGMPPVIADSTTDRVLPFAPPRSNPDARPSRFPLVNATRGWQQ